MTSFWFGLSLFLYIICVKIIAVPIKIEPKDTISTGLAAKLRLKRESGQLPERIPKSRTRREIDGCGSGSVYGFAQVPHCHVTNAVYDIGMKLCLVKLIHVPGMPDGDKGYNYLSHEQFLYKSYNATDRFDIVRCPTKPTKRKTTPSATTEILSTKQQDTSKSSLTSSKTTASTNAKPTVPLSTIATITKA